MTRRGWQLADSPSADELERVYTADSTQESATHRRTARSLTTSNACSARRASSPPDTPDCAQMTARSRACVLRDQNTWAKAKAASSSSVYDVDDDPSSSLSSKLVSQFR